MWGKEFSLCFVFSMAGRLLSPNSSPGLQVEFVTCRQTRTSVGSQALSFALGHFSPRVVAAAMGAATERGQEYIPVNSQCEESVK